MSTIFKFFSLYFMQKRQYHNGGIQWWLHVVHDSNRQPRNGFMHKSLSPLLSFPYPITHYVPDCMLASIPWELVHVKVPPLRIKKIVITTT
jgi:hypothetical protein